VVGFSVSFSLLAAAILAYGIPAWRSYSFFWVVVHPYWPLFPIPKNQKKFILLLLFGVLTILLIITLVDALSTKDGNEQKQQSHRVTGIVVFVLGLALMCPCVLGLGRIYWMEKALLKQVVVQRPTDIMETQTEVHLQDSHILVNYDGEKSQKDAVIEVLASSSTRSSGSSSDDK